MIRYFARKKLFINAGDNLKHCAQETLYSSAYAGDHAYVL